MMRLTLLLPMLLAAGDRLPPAQMEQYIAAYQSILGLPEKPEIEKYLRENVPAEWGNPETRKQIREVIEIGEKLRTMPAAQREAVCLNLQFRALEAGRKRAAAGDESSRWLVEQYDRAHPPIGPAVKPGAMPLTRATANGYLELRAFLGQPWGGSDREKAIAALAKEYAGLPEAAQLQIQRALPMLAAVKWRWEGLSAEDRDNVKLNLRMQFAPTVEDRVYLGELQLKIQQGLARNQALMLQKSWNNFMGNMETVYGYRRWNPVTNRYDESRGMPTTMR